MGAAGILALMLVGFIGLQGQSNKKNQKHAEERKEADAYALEYITCEYQSIRYQGLQNPENKSFKFQEKKINMIFSNISSTVNRKYRKTPEMSEDFARLSEIARKELTVCIEYQQMIDAAEIIEKKTQ